MRRANKWIAILLSTTLSLLVMEVALRTFAPRRTIDALTGNYPAMFKASDILPYRLRENYQGRLTRPDFDTRIAINSLGYRSPEFSRDKGRAYRILAVGDSFTFGWGVETEEAYPARLAALLHERLPSKQVEIINAGFAACYSPDTYYLYLKTEGLALKPDLVLVGIFVGNDLDSEFAFENEWIEKDSAGLPLRIRNVNQQVVDNFLLPRRIPFRYRAPLLRHSHVFQGLFDVWWEIAPRLKSWRAGTAMTVYAQDDSNVPFIYRRQYADRTKQVYQRVEMLLTAIDRMTHDSGAQAVFVVIPDNVQFSEAPYGAAGDITRPQRELGEFFDLHHMAWIDLLPWMKDRREGRRLYLEHDGHWNATAHALAAERLADVLPERWMNR